MTLNRLRAFLISAALTMILGACSQVRGTGDLGIIV